VLPQQLSEPLANRPQLKSSPAAMLVYVFAIGVASPTLLSPQQLAVPDESNAQA
jgi:hypothetical protein